MTATQKREIAFIDRGVDDLETLLAGIRPDVEPILLSNDEPAPRQMARAVQGREGLEAIHVIAHGRPGEVSFRAGTLSLHTLQDSAADLGALGKVLGDGGLNLWSCNVGEGRDGNNFINLMTSTVGARIATATDLVGSAARGGHWTLQDAAELVAPLTPEGMAAYEGV